MKTRINININTEIIFPLIFYVYYGQSSTRNFGFFWKFHIKLYLKNVEIYNLIEFTCDSCKIISIPIINRSTCLRMTNRNGNIRHLQID
jgi:hypothetical protein